MRYAYQRYCVPEVEKQISLKVMCIQWEWVSLKGEILNS
jgi:hypothetical protein